MGFIRVTHLKWIPVLCVDMCGSKNEHQKEKYLEEIRLRAQKLLSVLGLGSIVNIIGGTYMIIY